jgi:DNA mismatch repair ATPase MutL
MIYHWHIPNTNPKSHFESFEIIACRALPDYEGGYIIEEIKNAEEYFNVDEMSSDEPFYRIFGKYRITYIAIHHKTHKFIVDYESISEAILFIEELTGNKVICVD